MNADNMTFSILHRAIQPHEVEWRIQRSSAENTTVVPYLTNRCVMARFDEEFGPQGWQNSFTEWRQKGVKCGISVKIENEWITKYDGADESDLEATKGGFSDSMKRAAVQWGLGRDLYEYPRVMIKGQHKFIPKWAATRLQKLVQAQIEGKLMDMPVIILEEGK